MPVERPLGPGTSASRRVVLRALTSSSDRPLVSAGKLRIRSQPDVYCDSSGVAAAPARTGTIKAPARGCLTCLSAPSFAINRNSATANLRTRKLELEFFWRGITA